MARLVAGEHDRLAEELHVDVRAAGAQHPVPDLDDRRSRRSAARSAATPTTAPMTSATVVSMGANTSAAIGAATAALDEHPERGAEPLAVRSAWPAPSIVRAVFCITLVG